MLKELIKLADHLDKKDLVKEANYLDAAIRKIASYPGDLGDLFVPNKQNTEFMNTDEYMAGRDYRTEEQMGHTEPTHEGLPIRTREELESALEQAAGSFAKEFGMSFDDWIMSQPERIGRALSVLQDDVKIQYMNLILSGAYKQEAE